jgi:hypothetical protein
MIGGGSGYQDLRSVQEWDKNRFSDFGENEKEDGFLYPSE